MEIKNDPREILADQDISQKALTSPVRVKVSVECVMWVMVLDCRMGMRWRMRRQRNSEVGIWRWDGLAWMLCRVAVGG